MPCKSKRQSLLTLQVSRYYLLLLQRRLLMFSKKNLVYPVSHTLYTPVMPIIPSLESQSSFMPSTDRYICLLMGYTVWNISIAPAMRMDKVSFNLCQDKYVEHFYHNYFISKHSILPRIIMITWKWVQEWMNKWINKLMIKWINE